MLLTQPGPPLLELRIGLSRSLGSIQVMDNLGKHGILAFHFPGVESHGI